MIHELMMLPRCLTALSPMETYSFIAGAFQSTQQLRIPPFFKQSFKDYAPSMKNSTELLDMIRAAPEDENSKVAQGNMFYPERFRQVPTSDLLKAGATVICGGLLFAMDLLIRSDIKQTDQQVKDAHVAITMAKSDISDMKTDLSTVRSEVSGIKSEIEHTRNSITNQITLTRRMAGYRPFSLITDSGKAGMSGGELSASGDCISRGKGCP
ncbi:hypothetical protein HOY82DRAFT_672978 [Tuber indicum]|nr:hypothetical protein HOY82DRAFT_672978 [Tuber indicum]